MAAEIHAALDDPTFRESLGELFRVDPGHVRRKCYERAAACGFPAALGAPDAIRRARAVELMQSDVPLPVVQRVLGHTTLDATASYVEFSDDEIRQVARFFIQEGPRHTSARNTFFGKIHLIHSGDVQSRVELVTLAGAVVAAVITNDSLQRLGLRPGSLAAAEVKAPRVMLEKGEEEPTSSADNKFRGVVERVTRGEVVTEYVVRLPDGGELCSLAAVENDRLPLSEQDAVWAVFRAFAVVLHFD